jgi:hypothetical protein
VKLAISFLLAALSSLAQVASIRIEVKAGTEPVAGAEVRTVNEKAFTGAQGVAVLTVPLGPISLSVSKEGYFPATTALVITEAREWPVSVQLHEKETREEEITVFATRTDTRLQDSPVRVRFSIRMRSTKKQ